MPWEAQYFGPLPSNIWHQPYLCDMDLWFDRMSDCGVPRHTIFPELSVQQVPISLPWE